MKTHGKTHPLLMLAAITLLLSPAPARARVLDVVLTGAAGAGGVAAFNGNAPSVGGPSIQLGAGIRRTWGKFQLTGRLENMTVIWDTAVGGQLYLMAQVGGAWSRFTFDLGGGAGLAWSHSRGLTAMGFAFPCQARIGVRLTRKLRMLASLTLIPGRVFFGAMAGITFEYDLPLGRG